MRFIFPAKKVNLRVLLTAAARVVGAVAVAPVAGRSSLAVRLAVRVALALHQQVEVHVGVLVVPVGVRLLPRVTWDFRISQLTR